MVMSMAGRGIAAGKIGLTCRLRVKPIEHGADFQMVLTA